MANEIFADISSWQPAQINWPDYAAYSKRIALRADQGTGTPDTHYPAYYSGAVAAGIPQIIHYHYCYPNLNSPQAEAQSFHTIVGGRLRENDVLMLDYEQHVSQATADWLVQCAEAVEQLFGRAPAIYASLAYIKERLQDTRLAKYPLGLADWTFDENARPAIPAPFTICWWIQYTDKGTVPGISSKVDLNVWVGPELAPPQGPTLSDWQAYGDSIEKWLQAAPKPPA